jgi:hypothetical protein
MSKSRRKYRAGSPLAEGVLALMNEARERIVT